MLSVIYILLRNTFSNNLKSYLLVMVRVLEEAGGSEYKAIRHIMC